MNPMTPAASSPSLSRAGAAGVSLAALTTLRVGGPAAELVEVHDEGNLARAVREADADGTPLFVLGGGSNVLVGDAGFAGRVVRVCGAGLEEAGEDGRGRRLVQVFAGTDWDALAAFCVERGLAGLEALSGIPGKIGSAVMQNLGAYGQEAGGCLVSARLLDRATGEVRDHAACELGLGYRTSVLRASLGAPRADGGRWDPTPRWVVLAATFALAPSEEGVLGHAQLAGALGGAVGERMPLADIRAAVLGVRAAKGMVRDPDPEGPAPIHDRWSSGSFFTNPVLPADEADRLLPADAPRYPAGRAGAVKTSAAWLIDRAGFPRGFGVHGPASAATLSSLHTLALANRGHARAADVVELACAVRDGVRDRFGVVLEPETVLVGTAL